MTTLTFTEIKKAFNKEFPKTSVKIESTDGTYRPLRDGYGKTIRRIPTNVTFSPMDVTDIKANKVAEKMFEMIGFLQKLGGTLRTRSLNHAMVEFVNPKGTKVLTFSFFREQYRDSYIYDEGYKNIFFDVIAEII